MKDLSHKYFKSFMLCFKVYRQLTIGEDTPETNPIFMNLFY